MTSETDKRVSDTTLERPPGTTPVTWAQAGNGTGWRYYVRWLPADEAASLLRRYNSTGLAMSKIMGAADTSKAVEITREQHEELRRGKQS